MGTVSNLRAGDRTLAGGGTGPHDPNMEARIDRLDRAVERIDADLTTIRVSVARIEERLLHVPTTAALWKAVALSGGAVIVAMWALLQFLAKPWIEQVLHALPK